MVRLVEQVEPCQGVIALQGGHDLVAVPDIIVERVGAGVEYLAGLFVRGGGAELVWSAGIIFDLALDTSEVQNYPDVIFLSLFEHGIQQTEVLVAMVGPGLVLEVGPPGIRAADSHQVAMVVFKQSEVLIPELLSGGVLRYYAAAVFVSVGAVKHRIPPRGAGIAVDVCLNGELQGGRVIHSEELD